MGFDLNKKQIIGVVTTIAATVGLMYAMPESMSSGIAIGGAISTAVALFVFNTKKRRSA